MSALRVCILYPDELNLYADIGNLRVLEARCRWRGIEFTLTRAAIGASIDSHADLYYIGGGPDREQVRCGRDFLHAKARDLVRSVTRGAVVVGVCGGYQMLGEQYEVGTSTFEGVGLLGVTTRRDDEQPRLVGHAVVDVSSVVESGGAERRLAGFENHAGLTYVQPNARALGSIVVGHGNNGIDGSEGAISGRVMGTYLHGPLLAKNAWFADHLIQLALDTPALPELDDGLECAVHARAVALALNQTM